jgi:hypothetical protein
MSDSPNTPMYVGDGPPESFFQTWTKALTRPREETYAELAVSSGASPSKAYLWIFLAAMVAYFLIALVQALVLGGTQGGDFGSAFGSSIITLICAVPFLAGFSVLGFMLSTAIIQWVAGMFKGQGNYSQLAYVFGAIAAPITIVSGVIGALGTIPVVGLCFNIVSFGLAIYTIVLEIMAVKGVNKFGWGPAVGSVLLPSLVILFVCACVVIGILTMMGPIIGDVFSEINQSLMAP